MDVTIHVGLSKAASTFLQETYLPGVRDALFVHAPYRPEQPANPIQQFVYELLFRNPARLDRARFKREIADFLTASGHSKVIVSSEALFGTPFQNHSDFCTNTQAIADVFDDPKIWLVLRRQDRWLESTYSQFLKAGLSTTPERFTNYRDGAFSEYRWIYGGPNLDVRDLDWRPFVEHYREAFGADGVLVQPFEHFAQEPQPFLDRFCAFAGVSPHAAEDVARKNASLSPVSAFVARAVNAVPMNVKLAVKRHVPSEMHPALILNRTLDPLLGRRRIFPEWLAKAALEHHRDNNRQLAELLDVDLAALGYC